MKSNELMLGDYIKTKDGSCHEVQALNDKFITVVGVENVDRRTFLEDESDGIPISGDILEKNGFYRERNVGWVLSTSDGDVIYDDFYSRLKVCRNYHVIYDSEDYNDLYVHQLQHALKLCGIDKKIVP